MRHANSPAATGRGALRYSLDGAGIVEHGPHVIYFAGAEFSGEGDASAFLNIQHVEWRIFRILRMTAV